MRERERERERERLNKTQMYNKLFFRLTGFDIYNLFYSLGIFIQQTTK